MTVDTTGIKVIKGSNGHYSISGIEVAGASKVDFDTFMNVRVKVLDGKGNTITISDPIKLSVKGEQGMGMTINGESKTIKAGETADFGTIYIKEGESINFSASGISADALSVSEIDSATVDKNKGTITAKELTSAISGGNTEGKEITFTYGTDSGVITAKAKIVVVKTKIMAYYAPYGSTVEITDGETFWNASGNKITADFITEVDNYGKEKAGENVGKYEIKDGKVVFTYSKDSKITASCIIKDAVIIAEDITVDKNETEVEIPITVSDGLKKKLYPNCKDLDGVAVNQNPTSISGMNFSKISGSKTVDLIAKAVNENGIVVAQKTVNVTFTETSFSLTINGNTQIASSSNTGDIGTIYIEEGKTINCTATCVNAGKADANPAITAVSSNDDLVKIDDNGNITVGNLTTSTANNTTKVTFTYGTGSNSRTITADVVVVRPVAFAPAYDGNGYIDVTDDVYFSTYESFKAKPAFATKVDTDDKPILSEGLITEVFEIVDVFNSTGETVDWKCQGITITVKNRNIDPSDAENFFKANTNIRYTNEIRRDVKILTFENPWEKCSNLPADWSIGVVNADSNSEWTPMFESVSTVKCTRTGNTDLGDITTLNLTAELRDKNGNLVKQDTQTLNAYIRPKITAKQIFNSENKDFTYKVNLDVSGWEVEDAYIGSNNDYSVEFNKDTKEVTVKYKNAINNETKISIMVRVTNKDEGKTTAIVEFTATPVKVVAPTLKEVNEVDKTVTYGYTSNETFDEVIVQEAGYNATIDPNKKTVTVRFATKIIDTVELTLKNDKMEITKTLPTALHDITESNFSQSENIENKTFKYYLTNIPSGWTLESVVSKDESKYTASYNGNYELTVEAVGDTTDNEVALALTFTNGGLTWQKDVTLPVSRIDSFPQIKLKEYTANDVSSNTEFCYGISNSEELKYWGIRKEEEPQKYDINFTSSSKYTLVLYFTPAITETQENMEIKYQLQKEEAGVKHISPEYTIKVTATYTPPTSNP